MSTKRQAAIAIVAGLAAFGASQAAGPYRVYRVASPASAATAVPPMTTVMSGGTVSDPTLTDGFSYFYFVRDGAGATLELGANANRLAGSVQLTFDGTGTLREDAIGSAHDLFGPAGLLATMAAQAPGTPVGAALLDALQDGQEALEDLAVGSGDRDDNALQTWIDFVLRALDDARDNPAPFTVEQIAAIEEQVLELARALVTYRYELAVDHCGVCDAGSPQNVCQAKSWLDLGNARRSGTGTPSQVVDSYAHCISMSLQAMESCN